MNRRNFVSRLFAVISGIVAAPMAVVANEKKGDPKVHPWTAWWDGVLDQARKHDVGYMMIPHFGKEQNEVTTIADGECNFDLPPPGWEEIYFADKKGKMIGYVYSRGETHWRQWLDWNMSEINDLVVSKEPGRTPYTPLNRRYSDEMSR
jgi:hypothetical protein